MSKWTPNAITGVLIRGGLGTDPQRGGHVTVEAEVGVMQPLAQEHLDPQGLEEVGRTLPWNLRRELALGHLDVGLQVSRMWHSDCCFKLPD